MRHKTTRNAFSAVLFLWSAIAYAQAVQVAPSFEYGFDFYSPSTWVLIVLASVGGAVGRISFAQSKDDEMTMTPAGFAKYLCQSIIGGFTAFVVAEYYCQKQTPQIQPSGGMIALFVLVAAWNSKWTADMLMRAYKKVFGNAVGITPPPDKETK